MRINKSLLAIIVAVLSIAASSAVHASKANKTEGKKSKSVQEKPMYTLYTLPGSCSTGIAILMEKLGVSYKSIKRIDVPNYTDIVPTNQVPALKTKDGKVIAEGAAIALYLLEKHGKGFIPSNPEARAEFYQWLNFDYSTLHPAYARIFVAVADKNLPEEVKAKVLQGYADKVSQLWAILDKRLAKQKFILGDKPSHVDYMAALYISWNNYFPNTKITLGKHVKRFVKDVQALPEFKAGYAADGATFSPIS